MQPQIYLDYNASTPLAEPVIAAMTPWLTAGFGNPSSRHWAGQPARQAIDQARNQVADFLGCEPAEIVFTSGGTEANNHAIKGVCLRRANEAAHVITSAVEHPATLAPCKFLERFGVETTIVPVDGDGLVDPDEVRRAIRPTTRLISIMHANNEVGTIQPIAEISRIAREHGVLLHTDAAQSAGKIPTRARELGVDLLSIAGHKLYGPRGVGALYVRKDVELEPFMHGAGHESGRRAGTENTLALVGLGAASELAQQWIDSDRILTLRDHFWNSLRDRLGARVVLMGHPTLRLPNTLNVCFPGVVGAELLGTLEGVAASTGSACHSGSVQLSPVLKAMGVDPRVGMGAVRFSLGRETTSEQIVDVVDRLVEVVLG